MNILYKPDQTPVTWTLPKFDMAEVLSAYKMIRVAFGEMSTTRTKSSLPKFDMAEVLSAYKMVRVAFGEMSEGQRGNAA